jgi:hypothetical protein
MLIKCHCDHCSYTIYTLLLHNKSGSSDSVALEALLGDDVLLLELRCNDVSLACRKAAMSALTSVALAAPHIAMLQVTVCINDY